MLSTLTGIDRPAVAFVQGASGALGSAIARQLLDDSSVLKVFASSRRPEQSQTLLELRSEHPERLEILTLDVTEEHTIEKAAATVALQRQELDLVFNCSGLLHAETIQPEKRLSHIEQSSLLASFEVNAVGPILVLKHLVPLLPRRQRSWIINLSARVGSIGDNRLGGWYGYRASKSGLNMLTRCLALELRRTHPGCVCVAIHPGTVDTPLSRPYSSQASPVPPEQAASHIFKVVRDLPVESSGDFYAWDGSSIPW